MEDTTNLEQSTELYIGALAQTILDDVASYEKLQDKMPKVLAYIIELRMDVKFILMDLSTSYIAIYKSKVPYASRYHMKNLNAGINEAYKLLFNYGKSQRHAIWKKIGEIMNENPICEWEESASLFVEYKLITEQLANMAGNEKDKQHRDLTYHYNEDMNLVYKYTVAECNIETISTKFINFMEILKNILNLCDKIETRLKNKGIKTIVDVKTSSIDDNIHLSLIQCLNQIEDLSKTLDIILQDVQPIDDYVQHLDRFNKLKCIAEQVEMPELDNVFTMLNLHLTVLFMRTDIAAISKALLLSKTNGEAMLNMRRYVITITAAFGHLYGYTEIERTKSIWTSILNVIPNDNKKLQKEAQRIGDLLNKVVQKNDNNLRTNYVHLFDNQTHKTNIPIIINLLRTQDPISEMQKVNIILIITKEIMEFVYNVIEELAKEAYESNKVSTIELQRKMREIKDFAKRTDCPTMVKNKLIEMLDKIQSYLKIEV